MTAPAAFPPGVVLFSAGDAPRTLYLIEHGTVKLTASENGGRDVLVAFRHTGWLLGAAAVAAGGTHVVTARTVTPCALRSISTTQLCGLMKADRAVSAWLLRMLARECVSQVEQLTLFGNGGLERLQQFFGLLLRTATVPLANGATRLALPLSIDDVCQSVGLGREQVTRLLKQLEERGDLARDKGWFVFPKGSSIRVLNEGTPAR